MKLPCILQSLAFGRRFGQRLHGVMLPHSLQTLFLATLSIRAG